MWDVFWSCEANCDKWNKGTSAKKRLFLFHAQVVVGQRKKPGWARANRYKAKEKERKAYILLCLLHRSFSFILRLSFLLLAVYLIKLIMLFSSSVNNGRRNGRINMEGTLLVVHNLCYSFLPLDLYCKLTNIRRFHLSQFNNKNETRIYFTFLWGARTHHA